MSTTEPEIRDLKHWIQDRLEEGGLEALRDAVLGLHPSDLADILEELDEEDQVRLLSLLPTELASEALAEMEEGEDRGDLLAALTPEKSAELLHELADDDAADLIAELEPDEQAAIFERLSDEEEAELRDLLEYGEETAGGLMTTELVKVRADLTAQEALEQVREQGREVEEFYTVFVVDGRDRLLGTVRLDDLVIADPQQPIGELVEEPVASVTPDVDQEEVGRLIAHYNLASIPVVSPDGRLLGRITFDDVIDVIEAEQTEDILRLAGVGDEEALRMTWTETVASRLPWLLLNLLTAMLAASVVYVFSDTIENSVVLAAIMPIIAGMGGNAGTQALAVTVRQLAVEGTGRVGMEAVVREVLAGLVNGACLGLIVAAMAYLVGGDPRLGLVVLTAMWGNLVVAGIAGSVIPTVLARLGADPAVASSVFVTTLTDLCGFFFLLGLASAVLM